MSKEKQSIPPAYQYPPQQYPQQPPNYYQQQPQYPQYQQQQQPTQGLWNPSGVYGGVPEPKKGLRWWGWLLIILAAIVVISAGINQARTSSTTSTSTNTTTVLPTAQAQAQAQPNAAPTTITAPKLARIGDTQSLNGYLITVNAVQKSDNFTQGDFGKAKPGNTMLAVDLTVGSSKDSGVNPNGLSCTLKDSSGFKYSIIAVGYKDPLLPGQNDLANGDKVRGWVTFEVPKSASGFVLEYSPLFESGSVKVSLGN